MQPEFWLERWENNKIGWHQRDYNPLLQAYWPALELDVATVVFVPLCGKSLDMRWLEQTGHDVIGVELSKLAAEAYFAEGKEPVVIEPNGAFVRYRGRHTSILQGDFIDLTANRFPDSLGVFDRGALVALPPDQRRRYVDHLLRVVPDGCRMLLLTLEYDQHLVAGPPHSVLAEEVQAHYGQRCEIKPIDSIVTSDLPPHFIQQGIRQAVEAVYLITKID